MNAIKSQYSVEIYVNKHAIASNHYLGAYKHLNFHIMIILSYTELYHLYCIITVFLNNIVMLRYEVRERKLPFHSISDVLYATTK